MAERLRWNPWPDAHWGPADKPVVLIDGAVHRIRQLASSVSGAVAYAVGVDQRALVQLCQHVRVETLSLYEMRAGDLSPLAVLAGLRELAIRWNTKVVDISPIRRLMALRALVLEDVPRVADLTVVTALRHLRSFEFSGGVWTKNRVATLAPLADLPELETLTLANLVVKQDGLRPLAGCRALKSLTVSNQFTTEDYAFLSVELRNTACRMFAPFIDIPHPIGGKDVMVVGKGKPLLCKAEDGQRLQRYVAAFEALQDKYAKG